MTTPTLPAAQVTRPIPGATSPCCGAWGTYDADVARLRDLIGAGMGQAQASRIVWAGDPFPAATADVAGWVRRQLLARLPWLNESGEVAPLLISLACLAGIVLVVGLAVMGR